MYYYIKGHLVIIKRHILSLFFKFLRIVLYLLFAWLLYWLAINYRELFWENIVRYLILPVIFIIVNVVFLKITLYIIQYYNNLVIFDEDRLLIIKSTFILKDDIETIDVTTITKLDTYTRWIIANIFWYWTLIIEQTRDEDRKLTFMPNPQETIKLFREQKRRILIKEEKIKTLSKKDELINN